ncbi:iron complex transport system ATP-binding protein [Halopenitus malekzadehii]|uniref:Cobalamin import ATP-binding protein BtuD n=1 Tax=Halopenitus malekzadehii TaxID=1267564 RepID=A0A1H6I1V0_9EURY|nr:ABC transporter ATP-binding protein [Halopenitus malekzadehii]SEH42341.1 iron complex transport system ATP-binding protein [Halopenitus malekzadehii]
MTGNDRSTSRPADERTNGDTRSNTASPAGDRTRPTDTAASDPTAKPSAIHGEALRIGYPSTEEPVVTTDRVDVPAGEVTALVGPNGSGKSTLLKALAKQLEPEGGSVLLDGRDVAEYGPKEFAREVGLLAQENEAPGSTTVEELVYHGRYPHRGFFEAVSTADDEAVDRAIDLAGVDHLRESPVSDLSGGQKQLVWIAMTLAQETDVLLLDEPTTYLDLRHQLQVMEVIRELNAERGVTVAVVLHDLSQAARFADNLIAMKDGAIYDWGPPRKVVTEALLEDVFGVAATVDGDTPEGPTITPHRPVDRGDDES